MLITDSTPITNKEAIFHNLEEDLCTNIFKLVQYHLPSNSGKDTMSVDGKVVNRKSFLNANTHIFIERIANILFFYNAAYKYDLIADIKTIDVGAEIIQISEIICTLMNKFSRLNISACNLAILLRGEFGHSVASRYSTECDANPLCMLSITKDFENYFNTTMNRIAAEYKKSNKTLTLTALNTLREQLETKYMTLDKVNKIVGDLKKYVVFERILTKNIFSILVKNKDLLQSPHLSKPIDYNFSAYLRSTSRIDLAQDLFFTATVIEHGSIKHSIYETLRKNVENKTNL